MEQVQKKTEQLANVRRSLQIADEVAKSALDALSEVPEWIRYQEALAAKKSAKDAEADVDAELRELVLERYAKSKAKSYADGCVMIKTRVVVNYEREKAIEWCAQQSADMRRQLFKFDSRAFEKLAKSIQINGMPAEVTREPFVSVASDLSKFETH
jgi:hypothetical protein